MTPLSDISHILLYTLQKQHAISDIRHQTLYTILRGIAMPQAPVSGSLCFWGQNLSYLGTPRAPKMLD